MRSITILLLILSINSTAQIYKDPKAQVEDRIKDVLGRMTLEEKIDYIGGYHAFYIRGIERLGLPEIKMSDGPVGTRNDGKTTAYPASILTSATWDTVLARRLGTALGKDARARGVHILLGPGVNIYRAPMNGRNFEYLGEDPYLTSRMAVNYIKGVQSQRVVATVKHYAANNQEWDRHNVSSDMDERTLQEIYLPAFKVAVLEGNVGAVMNSYNLVNGIHATQNGHLNNDILKSRWGFKGILMSDWVATYNAVEAANNGLDLEMPSGAFMNRKNLIPAIQEGKVSQATIDDKVSRILRIIFQFGFFDNVQKDSTLPRDNPENARTALELARGGIVLLKNKDHILPLSNAVKTIAVIGPNADSYIAGGGSSYTNPFHSVSLLQGIAGINKNVKIIHVRGTLAPMEDHIAESNFFTSSSSGTTGLQAEYFNNQNLEGTPAATRIEKEINHRWSGMPDVAGLGADHFSARYTGIIRPTKSGVYTFAVRGDDGFRLWVNGNQVINMWNDHGPVLQTATIALEQGKEYPVRLEYYENTGGALIAFAAYIEKLDFTEAINAARAADVAIVSVGFNSGTEGEGSDRTFELPDKQDTLINIISNANPNTIVVLNAGGNVRMSNWLDNIKGLLHTWYPGQEGGTAIAEILFGKVNPSGKLPASFEKEWADNPTYKSYYDTTNSKRVQYKEGLNIGYRYYDRSSIKPLFPFGFGMSYTDFTYSGLSLTNTGKGKVNVRFAIKNTGQFDGAEISQVYVHQVKSPVDRPEKELKGFSKVFLKKGESRIITIPLNADAFSYFKIDKKDLGYDPGAFEILVGSSSSQIKLRGTILVK